MNAKSSPQYRAAVVGAGRIGSTLDTPNSEHVVTHAHALLRNPRTELAAIVDLDHAAGEKEAEKWNTRFFSDLDEMFTEVQPDIVVVATPDATHAQMLERVVRKRPRLVILEKPIAVNAGEAERLSAHTAPVPVIVNFTRRFDPVARALAEELARGVYGQVISAHATYVRGIFHNGSHVLDFARLFFGELLSVQPAGSVQDLTLSDPTVGGFAVCERCPRLYLTPGDGRRYAMFEFDILTDTRRIRFVEEGAAVIVQDAKDDELYKGFRTLGPEEKRPTALVHAMENLYAHAVDVLDGKADVLSSFANALKTHAACMAFLKSI